MPSKIARVAFSRALDHFTPLARPVESSQSFSSRKNPNWSRGMRMTRRGTRAWRTYGHRARLRSVIVPGHFAFRAFFVKRPKAAPRYRFRVSCTSARPSVADLSLRAFLVTGSHARTLLCPSRHGADKGPFNFPPNHEGNSLRFISHCTGCAFCTGRNYRQLGKDFTHAIKLSLLSHSLPLSLSVASLIGTLATNEILVVSFRASSLCEF